jgi:hypothetical protein
VVGRDAAGEDTLLPLCCPEGSVGIRHQCQCWVWAYYGTLSYTLRRVGPQTLRLTLAGNLAMPPGKIIAKPPLPGPLVRVESNGHPTDAFDVNSATIGQCPAEVLLQW